MSGAFYVFIVSRHTYHGRIVRTVNGGGMVKFQPVFPAGFFKGRPQGRIGSDAAGYGEYFGHSFGHGVGVEIHEGPNATPSNDKPLPAGAVISAEPGIYLPGKLGVRIEDVLYLTPEGCQNLTLAPKELVIL